MNNINLLKQYGNYPELEKNNLPDYLKNPVEYMWKNSFGGMLTSVITDLLEELKFKEILNYKNDKN